MRLRRRVRPRGARDSGFAMKGVWGVRHFMSGFQPSAPYFVPVTQAYPPQRTKNVRRGPRDGLGWDVAAPLALNVEEL